MPLLARSVDEVGQIRDPIIAGARRAALKPYRGARLQPSWPREPQHQADQNAAAKVASSGPEPSELDRTAPVPHTASTCPSDTAHPSTTGCSEHSPGNKALRAMRLILPPRAAYVVGHRAKHDPTPASRRRARATPSLAPTPMRWASGGGHGGEYFARKRQWVRAAADGPGISAFRRPCAAGPAIPVSDQAQLGMVRRSLLVRHHAGTVRLPRCTSPVQTREPLPAYVAWAQQATSPSPVECCERRRFAAVREIPPAGFEPAISCVKGRRPNR